MIDHCFENIISLKPSGNSQWSCHINYFHGWCDLGHGQKMMMWGLANSPTTGITLRAGLAGRPHKVWKETSILSTFGGMMSSSQRTMRNWLWFWLGMFWIGEPIPVPRAGHSSQFGRTLGDAVLIHTGHVPPRPHVLEEKLSLGLCRVTIPDNTVELRCIVVPLRRWVWASQHFMLFSNRFPFPIQQLLSSCQSMLSHHQLISWSHSFEGHLLLLGCGLDESIAGRGRSSAPGVHWWEGLCHGYPNQRRLEVPKRNLNKPCIGDRCMGENQINHINLWLEGFTISW